MPHSPDAAMAPDHVAHQLGGRVMALLIPVTLVMGVVVWSTANLSPIYVDAADSYVVVTPGNEEDIYDNLLSSVLNAVALVVMVLVTTLCILLLYYCRCTGVLYGWLMFSSLSIFLVMAWVWLDLVLTRFQVPYTSLSMAVVLWNMAVAGTAAIFFHAHPVLTQSSLLFASVLVAWSLTALPAWTAWSILLAIAGYDVVAVLCPGGPLRVLITLAQARGEPIPGFVYDTDHRVDAPQPQRNRPPERTAVTTEPQSTPTPTPTTVALSGANGTAVSFSDAGTQLAREERRAAESDLDEDLPSSWGPVAAVLNPPSLPPLPAPPPSSRPEAPAPASRTAASRVATFDELSPTQQMLLLSKAPFKLGLGDFIFYSMLVGEASLAGSLIAWTAPFLVVLCGMVITLVSLLLRRGRGALPALPVSIFAATLTFLLCRVSVSALVEGAASLNLVL